jgi:hypothetical protein
MKRMGLGKGKRRAGFIGLRWRRKGFLGKGACRLSMRGCRPIHRGEKRGIIVGRGSDYAEGRGRREGDGKVLWVVPVMMDVRWGRGV